jgi:MazG family protein
VVEPDRFDTLVEILDRLREPGGCPWDREQTWASLRGYLIEETYEAVDALDRADAQGLCEELGDLLLQIVFLSRLAKEQGRFEARDVVRGIVEKMVRRHPHVFGGDVAETSEDVLRRWEEIKREEKAGRADPAANSILGGVPRSLPALPKAQRIGTKVARVGFDWDRPEDVLDKVDEEVRELRAALLHGAPEALAEEVGDLLFSVTMLARKLAIDAEAALEAANRKFLRRFATIEAACARDGRDVRTLGLATLERMWSEAKRAERDGRG